jgi:hypothetical protein
MAVRSMLPEQSTIAALLEAKANIHGVDEYEGNVSHLTGDTIPFRNIIIDIFILVY